MSSGFVSGGTIDAPIERSKEWLLAQQELEETRRRKAEEAKRSDGKSLYETLEANKGNTTPARPVSSLVPKLSKTPALMKHTTHISHLPTSAS